MSERDLAVVELLGALTYGQLRAFVTAAASVELAPSVGVADDLAGHAAREHHRYVVLRQRLDALTDLPVAVMDRQRTVFDAFFADRPEDWASAATRLAVGLPIAADFARAVAPSVDTATGEALVEALADRDAFERFALAELRQVLADDDAARVAARADVAALVGAALTGFQEVTAATDALRVLFAEQAEEEGSSPEAVVRRLAIAVLGGHRRRMLDLGLDELDEP